VQHWLALPSALLRLPKTRKDWERLPKTGKDPKRIRIAAAPIEQLSNWPAAIQSISFNWCAGQTSEQRPASAASRELHCTANWANTRLINKRRPSRLISQIALANSLSVLAATLSITEQHRAVQSAEKARQQTAEQQAAHRPANELDEDAKDAPAEVV